VTRTHRRTVRTLGIAGLVAVNLWGVAGCSKSSDAPAVEGSFNQTIKGENGSESSVRFGADARLPADFPATVPLPVAGPLRSVVSEKNPPNASYTMTYLTAGGNGVGVGDNYRNRLKNAGYVIKNYSSNSGSDGGITQFDAIGKKWDIAVVSGKASPRDRSTLSVQVHTHGQITSGIGGIGDTTPNPGPTTTTTSGF
jgi:hypothetical protein